MNMKKAAISAALLGSAVFTTQAMAQAVGEYGAGDQGTVLVWPYDTSQNESTAIRIVNSGSVTQSVHFVRVCHGIKNGDDKCDKLDKSFELTPNETRVFDVESVFLTNSTPNCDYGHIIAYAETSFFSRVPVSYNHLYGDVRMTTLAGGRRMGMAPALAIRSPLADGTVVAAAKTLPFDGTNLEQVHNKLKSTVRAGASSTRNTRFYIFTFDITAGLQNPPTAVSFDGFNEAETPVSGSLEYVCSARVDTRDTDQLNGVFQQVNFGTPNGSIKMTSSGVGIGGWAVREEGQGKRAMYPLWNDDGPISTTFIEF